MSDWDDALTAIGWAAAAEVEQFAQVGLLTQTITVTILDAVTSLSRYLRQPIGPVAADDTPSVTLDGDAFADFDFVPGLRQVIRWGDSLELLTPKRMTVTYTAGFGDTADDIPKDLMQALLDQAALHFDGRSPMDMKSLTSSPHVARIGARYRGVQA